MASAQLFSVHRCRFEFRARTRIVFPGGEPGNYFRGSFGMALRHTATPELYERIFEPVSAGAGPSGFHDAPRPFVFRLAHLRGSEIEPGEVFTVGINLFHAADPPVEGVANALAYAGRNRMELRRLSADTAAVDLSMSEPATRARVLFVTPTELKTKGRVSSSPDFATLVRRARDRVSLLASLYGGTAVEIDFAAFGTRAESVRTEQANIELRTLNRTSCRTGQTHPIGGFEGDVTYAGDLGIYLPFLRAAAHTGVGRHTPWGNGQVEVVYTESS